MDEHTLNDLLECSVCLERLDTSSKVLPCQHTFCRKCLEVIVSSRQELRCPECRVLVDIKIDELPPNVLLMRILEGMKNAAAAAKSQQPQQHHHQQQQSNQQFRQSNSPSDNKIELQKLNEKLQQQQIKLQLLQKKLLHDQQKHKQNMQQQQQQHAQQQQLQTSTQQQQQQTSTQQQQQQHAQQQQQQHAQQQQLQTSTQQQQQQQHTQTNSSNAPPTAVVPSSQSQQQQSHHSNIAAGAQRRCLLPHAYALYDFDSPEPSDLSFKKGDLLLLKRKIDANWYVGQLSGSSAEGTFPINHVQVVVPLPVPTPQCMAVYDFKMPPNEEQGCLTFKKGTVIHVMRRVDHNWAEGRIGTTIGIFPIAFVELNALAKQLLEANYGRTSTPPSPTLPMAADKAQHQQPQTQQQSRNLPPIPLLDPTTNPAGSESTPSSSASPSAASSNASSNTNSPQSLSIATTGTTTTTTGSAGGHSCPTSMPNSPNQSLPTSPQHGQINAASLGSGSSSVRFRDKREKRHSLNALLSVGGMNAGGTAPALSILQSNRHSAEILSMPNEPIGSAAANVWVRSTGQENASTSAMPQSSVAREQQQPQPPPTPHGRVNVLKTNVTPQQVPPTLPWCYLALYPYKPRKNDELELKKGCVYIVTERCLDGWFKGKNWQDTTGVFPGNYVTPLRTRDQQQLMHQWKYVPLQSTPPAANSTVMPPTNGQNNSSVPDLPPRQLSSTLPISSVWTKPLGHTVEAFFNRHNSKDKDGIRDKDVAGRQKDAAAAISTTHMSTSCSSASSAVQLMKRLAHIKSRSKSPSTAAIQHQTTAQHQHQLQQQHSSISHYSMDNPTFEDVPQAPVAPLKATLQNSNGQLHPVHVRSGSCPSQLLQNLPHDLPSTASVAAAAMVHINENMHNSPQQPTQQQQLQQGQLQLQQQHKQQISPSQVTYGSQRLKGNKERPQLPTSRQSMDSTALRVMFNNATQQQPTSNLLLAKCAQEQQQQQHISTANTGNHRKCQSLDANTLMAAAPSNGGGNSGGGGGGVGIGTAIVAPCNITAAAIAASATTKSLQNTRESRFRCVVPYPPNSDVELELHVGDIIYVQRKQKNGWYKGTHARTNKTGLFPASFVEPDI